MNPPNEAGFGSDHLQESSSSSFRDELISKGIGLNLGDVIRAAKVKMQEDNTEKRNGVTYALFGGSGSGKSTLLRKVFIDDVYSNQRIQKKEDEYIPLFFTESKYADPLQGLQADSDDVVLSPCGVNPELYEWMYTMNYTYKKKYNFVVMVDDCIGIKSIPIIYKAFLTFRNMNITSVVSLQYLKLCPLSIRSSLYFVFLLSSINNDAVRQIVEAYMYMYLPGANIPEKMYLYSIMTRDHSFFMLDNLTHHCYYVTNDYVAYEIPPLSPQEIAMGRGCSGGGGGKATMTMGSSKGGGGGDEYNDELIRAAEEAARRITKNS